MAYGKSGRVVIDIDPAIKRRVYVALARRGLTMKEWFRGVAEELLMESEPASQDHISRHPGEGEAVR